MEWFLPFWFRYFLQLLKENKLSQQSGTLGTLAHSTTADKSCFGVCECSTVADIYQLKD